MKVYRITLQIGTAKVSFVNKKAFNNFVSSHARRRKDGAIVVGHGFWNFWNYDKLSDEDVKKIPKSILQRISILKLRRT